MKQGNNWQILVVSALGVAAAACNQAPEIPAVSLLPEQPSTTDDLVVEHTEVVDANRRDAVSVSYTWEVREAEHAEWRPRADLTGPIVAAAMTAKGQSWRVTVEATDDKEPTSSGIVGPVTVQNTLPEIAELRIEPDSGVATNGTLQARVRALDADQDLVEIEYLWTVNGTPLAVNGASLTGEHFDKHDVVAVTVTPWDGEAYGDTSTSEAVVIDNTPPTITGVRIAPDTARESSVLSCEPLDWADADDDPPALQVRWLVNGEVVDALSDLTGAAFDKGDTVVCEGIPDDGDHVGEAERSAAVLIENTPPRIDRAELSDVAPRAHSGAIPSRSRLISASTSDCGAAKTPGGRTSRRLDDSTASSSTSWTRSRKAGVKRAHTEDRASRKPVTSDRTRPITAMAVGPRTATPSTTVANRA